ncbi:uncharacterized protein JCM6883_000902 [Sporobolomyces salmoneus]|uniref:uncharacterized protein n=1 Tax=Sporobolomyces salmoneus TaxID=183962 RepID=UPI00317885C7
MTSMEGPLAPPTSLLDHTLRTAPLKVVYSTMSFTVLGGVVGAATGVARGIEAIPASFKTSLNTGVFSFTFFSIREYGLIPLFTHFSLLPSPLSPSASPPSPHTHNFLPTLISGIISGTLFSYFQRSTPQSSVTKHLKGGFTLGLGCLFVQSLVNEGDLLRINLLQRSEENRQRERHELETPSSSSTDSILPTALQSDSPPLPTNRPSLLSPLPPTAPSNSSHFSDPTSLTFSERSDLMFKNAWIKTKRTMRDWAPLKRIEKGEFEERVERERKGKREELEGVRRELRELEEEVRARDSKA